MSIQRPLLLPVLPNEPITKSPGRRTYSCKSQVPKVNGAENYRNTLEIEGISSSAANLSPCPGDQVQLQIDPVSAPLSGILNYLSTLFEKGLQCRTINSHRSAISAYHDHVDGKPVGKHLRVCPLLTGVFNQRPPQPRYTFVWDVEIVLVYLKTNMSDNSQKSDQDLTHELTDLMALSSASKASSLQHLNIKFMTRNDTSYKFIFINCTRVGEEVKLHQQSHIRHTHKILTFLLLRHWMNVFRAPKVGGLERSVLNFY